MRTRQILTRAVGVQDYIYAMSPGKMSWLSRNKPEMLVWMKDGVDAFVTINVDRRKPGVILDVYFIDCKDNTTWCEEDAVNPMGVGRTFWCGKNVCKVVVRYRSRTFWQYLTHSKITICTKVHKK